MTRRQYSRHGVAAAATKLRLRGLTSLDKRTTAAREVLAFKAELMAALGGEANLSVQRRKLVDMASRASALLDHVDAWLFEQRSLINARSKTLLPVLIQRQALADHLARLLEKLGLERAPQKVPDLATYLAQRQGLRAVTGQPGTSPDDAGVAPDPHEESTTSDIPTPVIQEKGSST